MYKWYSEIHFLRIDPDSAIMNALLHFGMHPRVPDKHIEGGISMQKESDQAVRRPLSELNVYKIFRRFYRCKCSR